jgi:hypothetical protein
MNNLRRCLLHSLIEITKELEGLFICLIALVITPSESGNSWMISVVSSDELPLAEKHIWWLDHVSLFLNLEFYFFLFD